MSRLIAVASLALAALSISAGSALAFEEIVLAVTDAPVPGITARLANGSPPGLRVRR